MKRSFHTAKTYSEFKGIYRPFIGQVVLVLSMKYGNNGTVPNVPLADQGRLQHLHNFFGAGNGIAINTKADDENWNDSYRFPDSTKKASLELIVPHLNVEDPVIVGIAGSRGEMVYQCDILWNLMNKRLVELGTDKRPAYKEHAEKVLGLMDAYGIPNPRRQIEDKIVQIPFRIKL